MIISFLQEIFYPDFSRLCKTAATFFFYQNKNFIPILKQKIVTEQNF